MTDKIDIAIRRFDELNELEYQTWVWIVETIPEFDSPYFRPEFSESVAAVRDDVFVAVLSRNVRPVGFLPFQRVGGEGRPVGGPLSDFHAVIAEPGVEWSVPQLLGECKLRTFHYHHLLASQSEFSEHRAQADSHFIDLSKGFDAYEAERREAKTSEFKNALRKERKLKREHRVRFEWSAGDEALDQLVSWKSDQYRRTELPNVFAADWTSNLLRRLKNLQEPDFGGLVSALFVDDQIAAVHFGIRSRKVLHYWFPAYGHSFKRYSPGLVLLLEMARECVAKGLTRIDLGAGRAQYKLSFGSGAISVAEGVAASSAMRAFAIENWYTIKERLKASPLAGIARMSARSLGMTRDEFS